MNGMGLQGSDNWSVRRTRWMNRLHARLAARGRVATSFVAQPEPRTIGSFARGRQLIDGRFLFGGHLVESVGERMWDISAPDNDFNDDRHGFAWLDDLAAVGDLAARGRAQDWTRQWIERFGAGAGPGWTPELTGRRITRWINHGIFLLGGPGSGFSPIFFRALSQQTVFLARRWRHAPSGLPRFEAVGGLIHAALALAGMKKFLDPAIKALAADCRELVERGGGLPNRNPQELLEVFTILTWTAAALSEAGRIAPRDYLAAIEGIAPTLRALRHADGGLARFHGGGRGLDGRLDNALAASGVKAQAPQGLAMGYARLSAGRTSLIVDASTPPTGLASANAHASTLAFELTSGRRPLIVNCGSGAVFGRSWHRAGRATPSHSTLGIEGTSSSKLGKIAWIGGREYELLVDAPRQVTAEREEGREETALSLRHDGFVKTHGLHHSRYLRLSVDGRSLSGEDEVAVLTNANKKRFDGRRAVEAGGGSVGFNIRFHLHPDVDAELDLGGTAVSLALKSGEIWIFRHRGAAGVAIEPSLFLEKGRLEPRATKQVVLTGALMEYATHVGWTISKAQDTPQAVRDLEWDGPR